MTEDSADGEEFYEEDEPLEDVLAAYENGVPAVTASPVPYVSFFDSACALWFQPPAETGTWGEGSVLGIDPNLLTSDGRPAFALR
jgi:hypothetical protein